MMVSSLPTKNRTWLVHDVMDTLLLYMTDAFVRGITEVAKMVAHCLN